MLLVELFKDTYEWQWKNNRTAIFETKQGYKYEVDFYYLQPAGKGGIGTIDSFFNDPENARLSLDIDEEEDENNIVLVAFYLMDKDYEDAEITDIVGTGDAFKVLATVQDIVNSYVSKENVGYVYFSAKESSRRKLYRRMAKSLGSDYYQEQDNFLVKVK